MSICYSTYLKMFGHDYESSIPVFISKTQKHIEDPDKHLLWSYYSFAIILFLQKKLPNRCLTRS